MIPFEMHMNIFRQQRNVVVAAGFTISIAFTALSVYVSVFSFKEEKEHYLYHRPQRPGRPPLVPPLGGGGVHPHKSRLASSRVLAAPSSALLASRVGIAALVRRQLARQPERGRHRPGRRRRRRLRGFGRREGSSLHRNH
jgi:hypothetical protein